MKKFLIFLILLAFLVSTAEAALTYGTDYYLKNKRSAFSGSSNDPLLRFRQEVDTVLFPSAGTGTIYYVDSGTSGTTGVTWATAVPTLQQGIDLCTDNRGDFVYVAQDHDEDIEDATSLDFDCPGITVVGFGKGEHQPVITLTTGATSLAIISEADITLYNLRILGEFTNGITKALDITGDGDGARILGCEFRESLNSQELLIMINITATADEVVIAGNRFIGIAGGTDSVAINMAGASNQTVIADNFFYGDWSDYVIKNGATSISMLIENNVIHNLDDDGGGGKIMSFSAASTGSIVGNKCYGNATGFPIIGTAMFVSPDNIVMATEDEEVRTYETMFGAFSGDGGSGQGDSIYADFVLAQADLDAGLVHMVDGNTVQDAMQVDIDDMNTVQDAMQVDIDDMNALGLLQDTVIDAMQVDIDDMNTVQDAMQVDIDDMNALGLLQDVQVDALVVHAVDMNALQVAKLLDHLIAVADNDDVVDNAIIAHLASKEATANWDSFNNQTDSLQAIRDTIDGLTGIGFRGTVSAGSTATSVVCNDLAGFGNDYFNTNWSLYVVKDLAGSAALPEGVTVDITDYATSTGTFTVLTTGTACATGDEIYILRTDELNLDDVAMLGASGNVWYVDSGRTTSNGKGTTWENAFLTITLAADGATEDNGDVVYIAAGHTETITAVYTIDDHGISFIGLGEGDMQPTLIFNSSTDANVSITGGDILLENIKFEADLPDVKYGLALTGTSDGAHIKNCRFVSTNATANEFADGIHILAGADDVIIEGCELITVGGGATEGIHIAGVVDNLQLIDNWVWGNYTVAGIWSDQAITNSLVKGNVANNLTASEHAIEFSGNATGNLVGNHCTSDTYLSMLDPGNMLCVDNWGTDVKDQHAVRIPLSAETTDIGPVTDGSNLERLEFLQVQTTDMNTLAVAQDVVIDAMQVDVDDMNALRIIEYGVINTHLTDMNALGLLQDVQVDALVVHAVDMNTVDVARDVHLADMNTVQDAMQVDIDDMNSMLGVGSYIIIQSIVESNDIPDNTQTAGAITGASSGTLLLVEISVGTDSTGWAAPTNIEFSTDNATYGATGAAAPIVLEVIASFGASLSFTATVDATTETLPYYLETGKKIYIHGDNAAGTGAGVGIITLIFQRISAGATIAAANLQT